MDKKNGVLNVVLIISGVVIVILLAFWGFQIYRRYFTNKQAHEAANEFIEEFQREDDGSTPNLNTNSISLSVNDIEVANGTSLSGKIAKRTYKGFTMDGIITIPKINLRYPILDRATSDSMDAAVGINYGPGLNRVGNTVIMGHNSKNGMFFSNLSKLENGDPIYIMDYEIENKEPGLKYVIYNIYEARSEELEYLTRDTKGKREISLSTCLSPDQTDQRLIIWAREAE